MSLLFWGMTLSVIGKGLLALGIIWVHVTMANERRIDDRVVRSFRTEMYVTLFGFTLIVIGYLLEVTFLGGFTALVNCTDEACTAAIGTALSL